MIEATMVNSTLREKNEDMDTFPKLTIPQILSSIYTWNTNSVHREKKIPQSNNAKSNPYVNIRFKSLCY